MQKSPHTRITAFAPATVANVACAFDILGFALEQPGDTITASFLDENSDFLSKASNQILIKQLDGAPTPTDPSKNTAGVAVNLLLSNLKESRKILLEIKKGLPIGSGLGSSAASAAAGLVAVNALLGNPLSKYELLPFAIESEGVACGSAHPDNVVPSLIGGCTLIRSVSPLDIIELPIPEKLICIVVTPKIELRTEDARKILTKELPLAKIVTQLGNVAGLISGFYRNDLELISRSLSDVLIEPQRALLIPGFDSVKQAALRADALGCSISGSGPTIFAFAEDSSNTDKIKQSMVAEFNSIGIDANGIVSKINALGTHII